MLACPMHEASGHTQPGKPGRMIVSDPAEQVPSDRKHSFCLYGTEQHLVSITGGSPRPRTVTTLYLLKIPYYCTVRLRNRTFDVSDKVDSASCTKS